MIIVMDEASIIMIVFGFHAWMLWRIKKQMELEEKDDDCEELNLSRT